MLDTCAGDYKKHKYIDQPGKQMRNFYQNELKKSFSKNILNNPLIKDSLETMQNQKNKNSKKLYDEIIDITKFKPILYELVNDYFSNINKNNRNIDIELPYIIQILALVNYNKQYVLETIRLCM